MFRPQAPHQQFGYQGGNFGPPSLGFSFSSVFSSVLVQSYINKQGGTHSHTLLCLVVDLFLRLQSQDSHMGQTHSGLLERDSALSISTKLAHYNRSLHHNIVNWILKTWGTPTVDMFATVHNMHLPQFMSPILET